MGRGDCLKERKRGSEEGGDETVAGQSGRDSISQRRVLILQNKDYSSRSIAVNDQSGPIGAGDAMLHRERVSKPGGDRGDLCERILRA